jgi:hypothetical protein
MEPIPILFNQSLDDLRHIGARGGRAYGRNCRARRQAAQSTPVPMAAAVVPPTETTAQAIAALDEQHPWLRGAERITSANPLLALAKSQESVHNLAVQSLDREVFLLQPPAEIGDYGDLLSDRVVSIALFGYSGRIGVEVFTQRPLAQSFNRT